MYTEEQARTKWCPMGRYNDTGAGVTDFRHTCVGSECAMWRWVAMVDLDWSQPGGSRHPLMPPKTIASDKGYCGLAGKPV